MPTYFDSCLFSSFILIFCLWSKEKIYLVLLFHVDFPDNVCGFFLLGRYIIDCMENSLYFRCFPGGGTVSYLALHDGYVALSPCPEQSMVLGVLDQNPSKDLLVYEWVTRPWLWLTIHYWSCDKNIIWEVKRSKFWKNQD